MIFDGDFIHNSVTLYRDEMRKNKGKQQDRLIEVLFECMARGIEKAVIKRKKELPDEDILFQIWCDPIELKEYLKRAGDYNGY